jgi:hypothetical protein
MRERGLRIVILGFRKSRRETTVEFVPRDAALGYLWEKGNYL